MSSQLGHGVVFFVMAVLVALFAWIYRRDRQQRVGLWMTGWAAILLDFATSWAFTFALVPQRLRDWMAVFTLEVAGGCFLFSVSRAFATARPRLFLSCFVILPAIVYWTCLVLAVKETWIYRSLLILAVSAAVAGVVHHFGRKHVFWDVFCLANIAAVLWVISTVSRHPEYGTYFFLLQLFASTGLVYWLRYSRFTPGVVVTALSFFAWGALFPARALLYSLQVHIHGDKFLWDLPKYFVALGMILTLFENQAESLSLEIRERKRAEQAALAANEAKSVFLATMSHEIRTPMNGILGLTDLLMHTELTEEQRADLNLVKSCAESLLTVINDVLDFSKIEARKLDFEHIAFDLHETLSQTVRTMRVRAQQGGLELLYEIRDRVPVRVFGDPGRLRQVLVNLIGNAIKFTEQGRVMVSVDLEHQGERETLLLFTVADTGIGIPLEKQKAIFEAFTQADGSTTRKYGGTGLGLAISSRLVEMMGGRIWVESGAENRGSIFRFTARFELPSEAFGAKRATLQQTGT
ncbi:MAG TPA: ATP-binding protein [Bryobacteraceae bacterium]|nr:ATP-binding protein [Bryobacteraceae bacterium]